MSELIKFPSHIQPGRVTVNLQRVDEIFSSPITNVQQVVSRGNPVWVWSFEYVDISNDERDIVQAFLMRCKGSVNTFRVTDPGDYSIKGTVSNWIDAFSNYGSFNVSAGSDSSKINSYFYKNDFVDHHITDERSLRLEFRTNTSGQAVLWGGEGGAGEVGSANLVSGAAYVQRAKFYQMPERAGGGISLTVGSGAIADGVMTGPIEVRSSDGITAPFLAGQSITSYYLAGIRACVNTGTTKIGDHFEVADYRLSRCALVCNSENLLAQSNNFNHGDWTKTNASVTSGFWDVSPVGVSSGGWKLYGTSAVNTRHYIHQTYTKTTTNDVYTFEGYGQMAEFAWLYIELTDSSGANYAGAFINVASADAGLAGVGGSFNHPVAKATPVGSGISRFSLTVGVSSLNNLIARLNVCNSDTSIQYTSNGSAGINIFGFGLRKFPLPGPYVPTTDTLVVGSGWQTGSKIIAAGFDSGDKIKAGQRFEIVNRFHNNSADLFERSEFKRITKEAVANAEGWAELEFDPPIRNAPVTDRSWKTGNHLGATMHNPIIFHKPEMKGRLVAGTIQYVDKATKYADLSFDIIEDMTE